jgi:hypothetical protein
VRVLMDISGYGDVTEGVFIFGYMGVVLLT